MEPQIDIECPQQQYDTRIHTPCRQEYNYSQRCMNCCASEIITIQKLAPFRKYSETNATTTIHFFSVGNFCDSDTLENSDLWGTQRLLCGFWFAVILHLVLKCCSPHWLPHCRLCCLFWELGFRYGAEILPWTTLMNDSPQSSSTTTSSNLRCISLTIACHSLLKYRLGFRIHVH